MDLVWNIAVAGSGKMGTDLVNYLTKYKIPIVWICNDDTEKDFAEKQFLKKAGRAHKNSLLTQADYDFTINNTVITTDISKAKDCEIIIEAIWEKERDKIDLFQKLSKITSPNTIFASNTSSIPISKLTIKGKESTTIGLHFFFPLQLKNIVEINLSADTSAHTQNLIKELLNYIEKKFIILPDKHSFLLNRILLPLQAEAYDIVNKNILQIHEVDEIVKKHIIPTGIFEFFDHVGIDVMYASIKNYSETFISSKKIEALLSVFKSLLDDNNYGIKSGKGFYTYPYIEPNENTKNEDKQTLYNNIILSLQKVFYTTIKDITETKIISEEDINYSMGEYLGEEKNFVDDAHNFLNLENNKHE